MTAITSAVLRPPPDRFPPGTVVGAYRGNAWSGTDKTVDPTGAADASATVAADGSLSFVGLTDQTTYHAWATGTGPAVRFATRHDHADDLVGGGSSGGVAEVFAARGTGIAATDTAVLQAAINATPAGGTLYLDGYYKINAALAVTQSISIVGRQKVTYTGLGALPSGPNTLSKVIGTTVEQTAVGVDCFTVTTVGGAFHMEDLVVAFTSGLASTGHGVNCAPTSNVVGVYGGSLKGVLVFGHDGNHYGLVRNNTLEFTTIDFRWWGGGGILDVCQAGAINYGNTVDINPYGTLTFAGTAHGFAKSSAQGVTTINSGGSLNLMVWERPQCNIAGAAANTAQKAWSDSVGAAYPWNVAVIGGDLEASGFTNTIDFGPGTRFYDTLYSTPTDPTLSVGYGRFALSKTGLAANITTQHKSAAFGYGALQNLDTGSASVAVGYQALQKATTPSNNTAVGYTALQDLTTGASNTAVGTFAGYKGGGVAGNAVIASSNNTHVGAQAGHGGVGDYTGTTALGQNAQVTGNYALALGRATVAGAAGAVAIGVDHNGLSASTAVQDEIMLGVALHQVKISNNATGAGSALLAANCPAVTPAAPYTWFKMKSSDGSTVYVPCWK